MTFSRIMAYPPRLSIAMHAVPPSVADVLHAFASGMPGLFFQLTAGPDGAIGFPYLSDGCAALLGLSAAELQAEPQRFADLIVPEDRQGYRDAMALSARELAVWNWEGRIRVANWNDQKWINLRATPRRLAGGALQWDGIMTNISASKLAQEESLRSRARLAELTAHIERIKEQERTRIAREIHDDLGGNLTAIKMALAMLVKRLPDDPRLQDKAAYVDSLVDRSIDSVHRISLDLRPSMLELGIVPALEWQVEQFERQNGLPCSFSCNEPELELALERAIALFRIFQEALTNVAKHAGATRVEVTLALDEGGLTLSIADDGAGIAPQDRRKPESFGLRGMQERAEALGGTLTLSQADGGGTIVTVHIRP